MTQVFMLHSAYGLITAAAAIDAEALPSGDGPRILIAVNQSLVPETTPGILDSRHLRPLFARFDRVESLDALLAPIPPTHWRPEAEQHPMLARLLRDTWQLGGGRIELFVQSPQVAPARTLLEIFADAPATVIGDGLMTYAPIRDRMPQPLAARVRAVAYADLLDGVAPVLFAETGAQRAPVPIDVFRSVFEEVAAAAEDPALDRLAAAPLPTALVLGQYLAALGLVTDAEEQQMQCAMIDRARSWAPRRIVFKPHPAAPPALRAALAAHARGHGLEFAVYDGDVPAEIVAARLRTVGVAAGFSTALPTVRALFGTPIASAGNPALLQRLEPFPNSNRIPIVIVDALTRPEGAFRDPGRLQQIVDTVGYAMQPALLAGERARAVAFLEHLADDERARYLTRRRLTELALPGAAPRGVAARVFGGGVGRLEQLRLAVRGAQRRLARARRALEGR